MKKQPINKIKNLDLSVFDEKLCVMAEKGEIDFALAEHFDNLDLEDSPDILTGSEVKQLYQTVNQASHENIIQTVRPTLSVKGLPFGRFLHLVRDKSGLTKSNIAQLLNKENNFIEKIESGHLSPLDIGPKNMVDIMQLFHITISELLTTIKASLLLASAMPSKASAMGRSSIKNGSAEKNDALSFAMDATLLAIRNKQDKKQSEEAKIDEEYINAIKRILQGQQETALLK